MMKKKIKKMLSLLLTVATIATSIVVAPVTASAATDYTPRKKHSKAEITQVCNFISEISDSCTMMPNGWFPASYSDAGISVTSVVNNSKEVAALQMTKYLMATPNITATQKKEMKRCMKLWRKAYYSNKMMAVYCTRWVRQMNNRYTSESDALKRANWAYKEVNKSVDMYSKYNTKLASTIRKWNKIRLDAWKAAVKTYRSMPYKEKYKEYGMRPLFSVCDYRKVYAEFTKRKIDPSIDAINSLEGKLMFDATQYYLEDCGMHPNMASYNSRHNLFARYIGKYRTW